MNLTPLAFIYNSKLDHMNLHTVTAEIWSCSGKEFGAENLFY